MSAASNSLAASNCDQFGAFLQPCNPAVGGPAKSQLVHEVDAMGGEIGKMADRCYLQKRTLNASKVTASKSRGCCAAHLPPCGMHVTMQHV